MTLETMSAWTTRGDGIDHLQHVRVPVPRPSAGQVLVRIAAVSLNYRDLLVVTGREGWKPSRPVVPVSDGVGEVVEAGDEVTGIAVGDRVSGAFLPRWRSGPLTRATYVDPVGGPVNRGMLAEYVVFDEDEVVRIPPGVPDQDAATLPVAAVTAWHAVVRRCRVQRGDRVLVHGTGGVALFALQFAAALGGEVVVTTSSAEKAARARALGASDVIVRSGGTDVAEAVLALTGGTGVDHVIETVGGQNLDVSLEAVRIGGSIAFIGLIAGLSAPVSTYRFVTRNVTIHGIETGSAEMLEELVRFVDEHRIRPAVDSVHPVAQIADALHRVEQGGHFGKIVVAMEGTAGPAAR